MSKKITVALAGNPNSGKTTIFNALTGTRQKVGNYPGVTVEKKEGHFTKKGCDFNVVDLPGTYSLTAYSIEEIVARNFILDNHPDVVVDVVDASNIERNLYLAVQLMELQVPLILVFNMSDIAKQRGIIFDIQQLSTLLGVKIIETVGSKEQGIDELLDAVIETAEADCRIPAKVTYGTEIENELSRIEDVLDAEHELVEKYGSRWTALKLIENDKEILDKGHTPKVLEVVQESRDRLRSLFHDEPEILVADRRYGFISGACEEAVKNTVEARHDRSDMIDKIVTTPGLGLIIFAALMYVVFTLTFKIGQYPMDWIEAFFGFLAETINSSWPAAFSEDLRSLIVDGVIGGVGGVIVFLPNIVLLFLAIAFLEDTGYMARAAFIMDRIMHKIGLHGKSFIPMLIGFGCTVPAIMSTRILENRRNRLTTIMVAPLMSCSARIPIYSLIIPAFFPQKLLGPITCLIYFIGIVLAILCAKLLRVTFLKGETVPFVMELPPYRMPTLKGLFIHMWDRSWMYLKKAGTVIFAISIVLWAATTYPKPAENDIAQFNGDENAVQAYSLQHSITGRIGKTLEPVIKPLGFDWRIGTALIGATAAKEVFVSQVGIVFSMGEADENNKGLRETLRRNYSPLQGFCIMLFCLIYAPCIATVAVTRRETNSWFWTGFQFFGLTALGYIITLVVYQVGSLIV